MTDTRRIDLLSLTPDSLKEHLSEHFRERGQPAYRVGQVERWIWEGLATGLDQMTDLPESERTAMAARFTLAEPEAATVQKSSDGTVKHLWRLPDGELVESVLIPSGRRLTLCISSQAGCAMGCTFCATGWGGFARQLTPGEIVSQYRASRRWAESHDRGPITNIVFMGMGEPLSNRRSVHPALTILNQGYGVGARRITVSTVGVVPGILELAERPEQFPGSPCRSTRRKAGSGKSSYRWRSGIPLPELLDALRRFDAAGGKRITFEYTMISGVNDDLGAGAQARGSRR